MNKWCYGWTVLRLLSHFYNCLFTTYQFSFLTRIYFFPLLHTIHVQRLIIWYTYQPEHSSVNNLLAIRENEFSGDMWRAWSRLKPVNHFILCPQAFRRDENAKIIFLEIKTRETYCWYDLNRVKSWEEKWKIIRKRFKNLERYGRLGPKSDHFWMIFGKRSRGH